MEALTAQIYPAPRSLLDPPSRACEAQDWDQACNVCTLPCERANPASSTCQSERTALQTIQREKKAKEKAHTHTHPQTRYVTTGAHWSV